MPGVPHILQMRQRRLAARQRNPGGRLALGCSTLFSLLAALSALLLAAAYASIARDLPSIDSLPGLLDAPGGLLLQATRLYDRSGEELLLSLENPDAAGRQYLYVQTPDGVSDAALIPAALTAATLASADPLFWWHPGFLPTGLFQDVHPTLAQQLASEILLWDEAPGLRRALRERLLAAQITARFGRQKVLEWYLNHTNYGRLAYGADAAARVYLDKSAAQINLAEAALLAAAAQSPALNPLDDPASAQERQRAIIQNALRYRLVSPDEGVQAVRQQPAVRPTKPLALESAPGLSPAFTNLVFQQIETYIPRRKLEHGGFKITTTLDGELQAQAACTAALQLARWQGESTSGGLDCPAAELLPALPANLPVLTGTLQANLAVIDPANGHILALVDTQPEQSQIAGLPAQPAGSLNTPFIYLTGFTRSLSPASELWDIPTQTGSPQNFDGQYHGPLRLRLAFANDYLIPAASVLTQVGVQNAWRTAQQLGIRTPPQSSGADANPLTLFEKMNLLDITQVFGIFANQGLMAGRLFPAAGLQANSLPSGEMPAPLDLLAVQRVADGSGQTWLDWSVSQTRPIITPQLAYLVTNILGDETARWHSLGHPNPLEIDRPAAAKVSRTWDGKNAWTVGYTPQRAIGVWVGSTNGLDQLDAAAPPAPPAPTGVASGLWHAITRYASQDLPYQEWSIPSGISTIQVCDLSGKLPTRVCPNVVSEIFMAGTEPTQVDDLYQTIAVNQETGRRATIFTAPEMVQEQTYLIPPPEAGAWAANIGLETPPEEYDLIALNLPTWPDAQITSPAMFAVISSSVSILGRASGPDFALYRLQAGQGLNPTQWLQIGEDTARPLQKGLLGTWDTSALNGLYALQLVVMRQDQSAERATILVSIDNQPPSVLILSPRPAQEIEAAEYPQMLLRASVEDNLGLRSITFYIDGKRLETLSQAPFAVNWKTTSGEHTLRIVAIDQAGNSAEDSLTFDIR